MTRPDGPAHVVEVPQTLLRAYCPFRNWSGPIRDASLKTETAALRRDVNVHNEEAHDEWPPR